MLGWNIVFALMTLPGAAAAMAGYHATTTIKTTSAIFAVLFLIGLFTQMVRGGTR
jgi:hypothetical protein